MGDHDAQSGAERRAHKEKGYPAMGNLSALAESCSRGKKPN